MVETTSIESRLCPKGKIDSYRLGWLLGSVEGSITSLLIGLNEMNQDDIKKWAQDLLKITKSCGGEDNKSADLFEISLQYSNEKNFGYHVSDIPKGEIGEFSKIEEELFEAKDALQQGAQLMALLEFSDMLGAIESYLEKHHPSLSLADLRKMSSITRRAFKYGYR